MIMFPEKVANQEGHGKADLQFDWLIILTQTFWLAGSFIYI